MADYRCRMNLRGRLLASEHLLHISEDRYGMRRRSEFLRHRGLIRKAMFWNVGYMKGLSDGCVQFPDDNSTGRIFQHSKHRRELVPTACVSCWNQFLIGYSKPVRSFSFQSIFSVHSDPIATIVTSLKCCRRCHVIWAVRTGIWSVERICCLSCCRRAGSSVWESGSHIDNLHTLYIYIIIMRIMEWQGHNARKLSVEGGVT